MTPISCDFAEPKDAQLKVYSKEDYWRKSKKIRIFEGDTLIAYYDLMNFCIYEGNDLKRIRLNSVKRYTNSSFGISEGDKLRRNASRPFLITPFLKSP